LNTEVYLGIIFNIVVFKFYSELFWVTTESSFEALSSCFLERAKLIILVYFWPVRSIHRFLSQSAGIISYSFIWLQKQNCVECKYKAQEHKDVEEFWKWSE